MPTCINSGCNNETRGRRFNTKDNGKIYYDKKCRSCEHTQKRYGMSSPDWKLKKGTKDVRHHTD